MKICFLAKIFYPFVGGSEIALFEVARRLARRGHDIHVITSPLPNTAPFEEVEGIKIHRIKMPVSTLRKATGRPMFLFLSAVALNNLLKNGNFDLVHDNISPNPSFGPSIAHKFGIPCTATVYDIPKWRGIGYSFWVSLINTYQINWFLKSMSYDGFIAVSGYTKRELIKLVKRKNIDVIYNGANIEEIDKVKVSKKFKRPTVIYVGRFSLNKRVDWLLLSINELVNKIPNIQLLIVGDGPKNFKEPVIELWKELKLQKHVKFLGEKVGRKKIELIKKSHLLVLPTTTEGSPLVIAEAMACKVPVVASNVGGISEMITNSGYLVNGGDVKGFSNRIEKILTNDSLRRRLGEVGRKIADEKFDWNKIADKYEDFFNKILQKKLPVTYTSV